jgi:CheY-like chemotaxis protein
MQAAAAKGKVRRRVLVVDDNIDNVRSLTMLFDSMGHQVDYAINAIVAVDLATRFKPDVVILDLLLPDGHGAQVCRQMRLNPELRKARIYGITGSSNPADRQRALEAGCDDVLLKPIPPERFERLLAGG